MHYNEPLVMNQDTACRGDQLRRAALTFYSQIKKARYNINPDHPVHSLPPALAEGNPPALTEGAVAL